MPYIVQFIDILLTVLWVAILGRAIVSWMNLSLTNPLVNILFQITEPILSPIRRVLPRMGMIDLSPMVAIVLIYIIRIVVVRAL
jgi:YggT family protein